MSYEFQGISFATEARWLRAIAQGWLRAGGWNDAGDIQVWLDTRQPAALATVLKETSGELATKQDVDRLRRRYGRAPS